jgi:hypothetical protein
MSCSKLPEYELEVWSVQLSKMMRDEMFEAANSTNDE